MMKIVDFDEDVRQVLPTAPTTSELVDFQISAQRHAAYEGMWRGLTFVGVLANTAMWLYF